MSDDNGPSSGRPQPESSAVEAVPERSVDLPFAGLTVPAPIDAAPPPAARWLAFLGVLVGGLLGALVGFGIGDILYPDSAGAAVAALAGGVTGAVGLGVLANLTLRAMNEWETAGHPEDTSTPPSGSERRWTRRP